MSIDTTQVRKIASLARLRLNEAQEQAYTEKLNTIMEWVEGLASVNTDGIEPMISVVEADLPMRSDMVTDGNIQADILANAPDSLSGFFAVPKIVE